MTSDLVGSLPGVGTTTAVGTTSARISSLFANKYTLSPRAKKKS
jgi:hypothetical protein